MRLKRRGLASALETNSITQGVIWKNMLLFFFPILLGTFFQQMYNTADAIIVGKFVGTRGLAAVGGTSGTMINLIVGFFVGLSSGATVILSQYYGGARAQEIGQTVHTAIAMAIGGGLIIMLLGYTLSARLLSLMGTPPEVMPEALTYIRIYFAGMIPSLIYNIGSGLLRAVGDSRRPLLFLIAACLTNIVLDVLFVAGFEMGVAGAALATILSQLVSAVLVIYTLTGAHTVYRLEIRKIRFHLPILKEIVKIGLPGGLQSVMYSVSNVIIQAGINGLGTSVMAAYTAYGKLDGFFWMMINAFGVSVTTFVGQNFGARSYDRVQKSIHTGLIMASVATLALSTALLTFGHTLYHLFTDDPVVIDYGMQMLWQLAPMFITYVCIEIFSGALRGVGDALVATIFTLGGVCVLRLIWLLIIVPMNNTLYMILLSYPITWTITSLLFVFYYLKSGWLKRAIRRAGLEEAA
ncbi:MAG: MATE family efflux transporter [Clostridia bacterium]|nr:MATE family efflux transporter [Clostridia bacterium]